jgi:hypothetical protein
MRANHVPSGYPPSTSNHTLDGVGVEYQRFHSKRDAQWFPSSDPT